ncbi:MAG: hypothetical protein PHU33_14925 [Bacteroidales bacterium]|nr:hypothetical protein [Bacteroidales bacterium]MDD3490880.1 hypothetical protein [Paludibacter sp.]
MKKKNNRIDKKNFVFFGKIKISKENLAAIIICSIIIAYAITWSFYRNNKLNDTEIQVLYAKIVDKYRKRNRGTGFDIPSPEIKCKYYIHNKEYLASFEFSEEIWDSVNVGDCIEILVSMDDAHIYKWNKDKGIFKCP